MLYYMIANHVVHLPSEDILIQVKGGASRDA